MVSEVDFFLHVFTFFPAIKRYKCLVFCPALCTWQDLSEPLLCAVVLHLKEIPGERMRVVRFRSLLLSAGERL